MMAKEYYDHPAMRWAFQAIEAIPVARSGKDMLATRMALRALGAGKVIGIFPEGKIETSTDLLPFEVGVAMLAHHAQADVFPAYLDGTQRGQDMLAAFFRRQCAKVAFGRKLEPHVTCPRPDFAAITERIQEAVESLRRTASSLQA